MSKIEITTRITWQYLRNRTKDELCQLVMLLVAQGVTEPEIERGRRLAQEWAQSKGSVHDGHAFFWGFMNGSNRLELPEPQEQACEDAEEDYGGFDNTENA